MDRSTEAPEELRLLRGVYQRGADRDLHRPRELRLGPRHLPRHRPERAGGARVRLQPAPGQRVPGRAARLLHQLDRQQGASAV